MFLQLANRFFGEMRYSSYLLYRITFSQHLTSHRASFIKDAFGDLRIHSVCVVF